MPDVPTLVVFGGASLALLVVPGPAVLYVVTRSLEGGRAAGLVAVLGIHAGSVVHVAAAAVGLSALLASSATAFAIVKYLGAAYLVYLGVKRLRRRRDGSPVARRRRPHAQLWREGMIVSVLNPKTAMFFLAFLPQFVDPGRGAVAPQVLLLGTCFIALGVLSDGTYAIVTGAAGARLRRSATIRRRLDRLSGGIYVSLGAAAALSGDRARSG